MTAADASDARGRPATIRPARADEAAAISALALRSKAHWAYTADQMAVFRDELTLAPGQILDRRTQVLEGDGRLLGFYTLLARGPGEMELEHIFIEPGHLGRGHGTALFRHAADAARRAGVHTLVIQSDPNAAGFYRTLGARLEREIPSSIPGRTIPCFTYALGPAPG